jgi:phage gp46-like protein
MATPDGDIKLFYAGQGPADVRLLESKEDFELDHGLENAVLISLGSDRRASRDDEISDGSTDPRGFWADSIMGVTVGSRLWSLDRSKLTPQNIRLFEQFCEEALNWMLEDKICDGVSVTATRVGINGLQVNISVTRRNMPPVSFAYYYNWQAQLFERT